MALAPRLDLRQSQSLVMTPQLQQAIKLLALSNLELEGFIAGELERNPLLETAGGAETAAPDMPEVESEPPLDVDLNAERFIDDGPGDAAVPEPAPAGSSASDYSGSSAGPATEDGPDFDSFASPEPGLQVHLLAQAGAALSGLDLFIAGHLIGQIDAAGYLEADVEVVASQLAIPRAQVEHVLGVIQGFDPSGVGARTLAECIAIQAREVDRYDPAMATLIANLDLLARGQLAHLRRICGVDEEDMADMIRELRGYDPKPGLRFERGGGEAVVPDVIVRLQGEGWAVEINGATLPRLLLNRRYQAELGTAAKGREAKAWLADCLASANWLLRALDQRQRTILKVAGEIVTRQEGFFREGVTRLRPLTLRAVADAVGLHESTVSRVTSNKYLSCPRGTFELKYFFTSAIQAADGGEASSAEAVKSHIRALIAAEQADAILSDDTLVDLLRERGFDIARRTVAKYREAMGLGSSVQRRRQNKLAGG